MILKKKHKDKNCLFTLFPIEAKLILSYIFFFLKNGLPCSPSWLGTCYVEQVGLKPTKTHLPLSPECCSTKAKSLKEIGTKNCKVLSQRFDNSIMTDFILVPKPHLKEGKMKPGEVAHSFDPSPGRQRQAHL